MTYPDTLEGDLARADDEEWRLQKIAERRRCPECGYSGGFHTVGCPESYDDEPDEPDDSEGATS